jgi:hypothetical protein
MISSNHPAKQDPHLEECLDSEITTEEESDDYGYDDDDEEKEFAYQCDFQKKRLPVKPYSQQSLLSDLLSCSQLPQQEQNSSLKKSPVKDIADPLSESLKRNLEWEQRQSISIKGQGNTTKVVDLEEPPYVDNLYRW